MPRLPLIRRNTAFLLLFSSVMTMIAGGSSPMGQEVSGGESAPPQERIVLDSIGDLPTSTRFEMPGSGGIPLGECESIGPEFTLTKRAAICEIGAYVESCYGLDRGQLTNPSEPIPAVSVTIYPQCNGKPDVGKAIATYTLSNDNDRTLITYESIKVRLPLPPGTYYAIFNDPSKTGGIILSNASYPREYLCSSVPMAYIRKNPDEVFSSRQHLAVRILKESD